MGYLSTFYPQLALSEQKRLDFVVLPHHLSHQRPGRVFEIKRQEIEADAQNQSNGQSKIQGAETSPFFILVTLILLNKC